MTWALHARKVLLDAGERAVELGAGHGVEEVRVMRRRLRADDGEVFTPFADAGGVEGRGLLEEQREEGEGHTGVRLRQPGKVAAAPPSGSGLRLCQLLRRVVGGLT